VLNRSYRIEHAEQIGNTYYIKKRRIYSELKVHGNRDKDDREKQEIPSILFVYLILVGIAFNKEIPVEIIIN